MRLREKGFIQVLFLVIIAAVGFVLISLKTINKEKSSVQLISPTPTKSTEWDWSSATEPELGRLYYTSDGYNRHGIYYTNEAIRGVDPYKNRDVGPYVGRFVSFNGDGSGDGFFHFLKDPTPFSHDVYVESIEWLVDGAPGDFAYAYIKGAYGSEKVDETAIYLINKKDLTTRKIWVSTFEDGTGKRKGIPLKDSILENKYALFSVRSCQDCGGSENYGELIVNINNGNEKFLTGVGDFDVNLKTNSFSYQKLSLYKEACNNPGTWGCGDDGTYVVMRPTGEIHTEKLP